MQFDRAAQQALRSALIAAGAGLSAAASAVAGTAHIAVAGDGAANGSPPWRAVALLAAVGAVCWAVWALLRGQRQRRDQAAQLRVARTELQALGSVLDVWQWRTDRGHRLRWLRPPAAAADGAWRALAEPTLAWDCFRADDAAALRARFEAAATFDDLAVTFGNGDGGTHRVQLRAVALADANGRFDGHLGTARELPLAAADGPARAGSPTALAGQPAASVAGPVVATPGAGSGIDVRDSESFIYTVSHDLRAPIRVIEGFTKIVKEDYGRLLDRVGNDHLDRVLGAAVRMNSMIDAMLALSQLSARPLTRQPVDLSQLAAFVADDLRRTSPQREVELQIEPGMLVHGDPTLLRVMLENLLGNAWKYTGKTAQPRVRFDRDRPHPAATFCLRDNGAGFDMRFADRLFGAFQRLHSANDFHGTGVGLASVRRIVRRHGGDIWAEAEVERGAAFYFSLPGR